MELTIIIINCNVKDEKCLLGEGLMNEVTCFPKNSVDVKDSIKII